MFKTKLSVKDMVLFTLFAMNLIDQPTPLVEIEQGVLSGKINSAGTVFEYLGIPYASIKHKFRAPLPPPSWDGTFKAVDEHYHCLQAIIGGSIGIEDCLKINVYVPAHAKTNLPVMVYIHGGGFVVGNGGKLLYGSEFLVRHDVIVVTFNYRLGALGFLCLGIEEAPGNAGLKDQIAALRWIQKNIAAFGGDPDNVTIFGHSAGAGSVSLLVASKLTDGLFHKAIVQSGAAISTWSCTPPVVIPELVAKQNGYDTNDPYELYKIYLEKQFDDNVLLKAGKPIIELLNLFTIHLPCIEANRTGEAVIDDFPYNLLMNNSKNIPMIYGITDKEGMFLISEETDESLKMLNQIDFPFHDLEFDSEKESNEVWDRVKKFYFSDKNISQETLPNLAELYGDLFLAVPTILESEIMLLRNKAPIYHYFFKYSGKRNLIKDTFCLNAEESGASHGDDILYIFRSYIWPYEFRINKQDQKIIDWLTKMWTNFAKYGNPTPSTKKYVPVKWEPSKKDLFNFLYIDKELKMGSLPYPERYKLWKDIYEKYRKTKL